MASSGGAQLQCHREGNIARPASAPVAKSDAVQSQFTVLLRPPRLVRSSIATRWWDAENRVYIWLSTRVAQCCARKRLSK